MRVLVVLALSVAGVVAVQVAHVILVRAGRRLTFVTELPRRAYWPAQVVVSVTILVVGLQLAVPPGVWRARALAVLTLVLIASCAWAATALVFIAQDIALLRFKLDVADNR